MARNVGDRLGHYDVTALTGEGDPTDQHNRLETRQIDVQ